MKVSETLSELQEMHQLKNECCATRRNKHIEGNVKKELKKSMKSKEKMEFWVKQLLTNLKRGLYKLSFNMHKFIKIVKIILYPHIYLYIYIS